MWKDEERVKYVRTNALTFTKKENVSTITKRTKIA